MKPYIYKTIERWGKKIPVENQQYNTTFLIKESISLIEIVHLEIYRVAFVLGEI